MIHIACNIDANFIQHCAVTLVSLFENNKRADICVHIWGIERSGFFNGREKWAKDFENQRV